MTDWEIIFIFFGTLTLLLTTTALFADIHEKL